MPEMKSDISGLYKLPVGQRLSIVSEQCGLSEGDAEAFGPKGLSLDMADNMIENVIGTFALPVGVATNFRINGRDYLIPMVTEEPSVVAACSNAAKMIRAGGGFTSENSDPVMVGQIQIIDSEKNGDEKVQDMKAELMELADSVDPTLVKFGGGIVDITTRWVDDMLVVHLHVNVSDAMGANAVNTMCEKLAPKIEEVTGGYVVLKILSNYAVERTATAKARVPKDSVGGQDVVDRIIWAQKLAEKDVFRAVTHNKGVMNGVTSVVLATGNDTRAVESGCHSYAVRNGAYTSLTMWKKDEGGDLVGELTIPVAVGLVGGATRTHPVAKAAIKILGVKTSKELGQVLACVGLAQNLAAIRALAAEGIQKGHMRLHSKNIAILAGAKGDDIARVSEKMVESGNVSVDEAKKILKSL